MDLPDSSDTGAGADEPARPPPPLTRRWPGDSSISQRVLAVGCIVTAILIVLAFVDVPHEGIWQNLHWNASAITAFLAVAASAVGAGRRERVLRLTAAAAIGMWMFANILWTAQVASNQRVIPSLPDFLAAAVLIPGAIGLVAYVRGRLTRTVELAVYIDAAVVATTVFAYLFIALGPAADRLGLLVLAAPLAYLTMAGAGLVALLATGYPISSRGGFPIVAGIALVGIAWVGWAMPGSTGIGQPAQIASPLFSIGILLVARGASTRQTPVPESMRYRRLAPFFFRLISPLAAGLTFLTILPVGARSDALDASLRLVVMAAGILILIRQGLLLRQRVGDMAELEAVHQENERLVITLREELAERLRVQDELITASRMSGIGELSAGVAHEVNNPLTGVLLSSELLLQDMAADDPKRADVQTIWEEAMRARSIVRSLRDFARPTSPQMAPTDLPDLVTRSIDLLRRSFERTGVIITESHDELGLIELDPQAIQQVILNVLTNALQAMPRGGTLRVETFIRDGDAVVTIADDGEGMEDIVAAQAFVPFFTARDETGAAGLGLAASLGLVESHGGTITIQSQLGVGTTVEIRLPMTHPGLAPDVAAADPDTSH